MSISKIGMFFLGAIIMLASSRGFSKDTNDFSRYFYSKSNLGIAFFHSASYRKERPILFFNQTVDYKFHKNWSAGVGFGIEVFPLALATPFYLNLRYCYTIKRLELFIESSVGKNLKLFPVGFNSTRTTGIIGMNFILNNKVSISPQLGYLFLWDKYGGASGSATVSAGVFYKLW